jgi:hypothetical protein
VRDDAAALLTKGRQRSCALDPPTQLPDPLGQNQFCLLLGVVQQEREPGAVGGGEGQPEGGTRPLIGLGPGDADPRTQERLSDTEVVEDLEGPRGQAGGARGGRGCFGPVDQSNGQTAPQEVGGQGESGGAGTHDEDVSGSGRGHSVSFELL